MSKISKIEIQKNNKNRVNVYIEDEYVFSCAAELIYRRKLSVNESIDLEYIKSVVEEDNFIKAKTDALRAIEKTLKTEKEVTDKLSKKGYDLDIIKKVIEFLKEYEFLNDSKYAEMYIKDKLNSSGRNKIIYTLRSKGIDKNIINNCFSQIDKSDEQDGAFLLASKKYNLLINREKDKKKLYQKLVQYLSSKGYEWEVINGIVNKLIKGEWAEE